MEHSFHNDVTEESLSPNNVLSFYRDAGTEETKIDAVIEEQQPKNYVRPTINIVLPPPIQQIIAPPNTRPNPNGPTPNPNEIIKRSDFFMISNITRSSSFPHNILKKITIGMITFFNAIIHTSFRLNKYLAAFIIHIILTISCLTLLIVQCVITKSIINEDYYICSGAGIANILYAINISYTHFKIIKFYQSNTPPIQINNDKCKKITLALQVISYIICNAIFAFSVIRLSYSSNTKMAFIYAEASLLCLIAIFDILLSYTLCVVILISMSLLTVAILIAGMIIALALSLFILIYFLVKSYKEGKANVRKTRELIKRLENSRRPPINDEMALECTICLCNYEQEGCKALKLECGHLFHFECLKCWITANTKNTTCPNCRKII